MDNNQITEIQPNTFPEKIYKIKLSSNRISRIETLTFSNLINVNEINLNSNNIRNIANSAFDNCRSLKIIYLKNNNISLRLISNMFSNLPRLKFVIINDSHIFSGVILSNNALIIDNTIAY